MRKTRQNFPSRSLLHHASWFFSNILNEMYDCVWLVDKKTNLLVYANQACERLYGYFQDDFIGMPIHELNIMGLENIHSQMTQVTNRYPQYHKFEALHAVKSKREIDVEVVSKSIKINNREFFISRITDITECKKTTDFTNHWLEQLHFLSYHDLCTGAYNSQYLERILLQRYKEIPACFISIHIDSVKKMGDDLSYPYACSILSRMAQIIYGCVRKKGALIRNGQDDFLVFLPDTGIAEAKELAGIIRNRIARMYFENRKKLFPYSIEIDYTDNLNRPERVI